VYGNFSGAKVYESQNNSSIFGKVSEQNFDFNVINLTIMEKGLTK